jgi:hypothetical protein
MTLRKLPDTGQLLLDDQGRLYAECCCDPPPEGGWYQCIPQYCAGDYASRFPNVPSPKFMVYFALSSFNRWRDNGFPSVLYIKGPALQTYVIGEFLTGAANPESEGYVTENGWLSLGSSDGRFSLFETSPTLGGALSGGHMTSVPPPEFTVVDTNSMFIVHILAGVQRRLEPTHPPAPNPGQLNSAAGQYKMPSVPPTATLDIGQLPSHSEWRTCDPIIDDVPGSITYGAVLGFETESGTIPGFGPLTVPAFSDAAVYDFAGSFDLPDTLISFAGRSHRVRGSAGLRQLQVVQLDERAACQGSLGPPPAFSYTFGATLHGGTTNNTTQCGNNPDECNYDARCGCPDCVIVGPPCWPAGDVGAPLQECDFEIAGGGNFGAGMESDALPICTAYRDELPSGSPSNLPYLGSNIGLVGPNVSYGDTGLCPRKVVLDGVGQNEIGFSTMGITF